MAITISLVDPVIDLTANTGLIVDGSTYTSPTRATCGVYVKVYKLDYTGARSYCTTTPNNNDANTDSQWTFAFSTDGWHQVLYVAPPDYAGGTTYAKYDAVFDPTNKLVYRSKSAGNVGNAVTNTTFWELISDPTSLALNVGTSTASVNLNTNTSVATLNLLLRPKTKVNFGTKAGDAFLEASSDYKRSQDVRLYELLDLALNAMTIAENRLEFSQGELYARRAISLVN
jgi:hypothetical protein